MDQDEGPRHAEEQIEQDEAQPPRAQIRRTRRLVEKLPAGADDDEMDDERAGGPHARGHRSGPQARQQPDGDHEQQRSPAIPTAGSARTGAAIRSRRPAACRWSRSAGRAPRARAGWQGGAWSRARRRRRAMPARADRLGYFALHSAAGDNLRQKSLKFLKTRLKRTWRFRLKVRRMLAFRPVGCGGQAQVGIGLSRQGDREGSQIYDEAL